MTSRMFRSLLVAGVTVALSACAVGPDFKRPDPPSASRYTVVSDDTQRFIYGETPPNDWWTVFQNDELNRLMQQAKEGNYTLAAARSTLAQADELLAARRGTRLPKVNATGGSGRQQLGAQALGDFKLPTFTYYAHWRRRSIHARLHRRHRAIDRAAAGAHRVLSARARRRVVVAHRQCRRSILHHRLHASADSGARGIAGRGSDQCRSGDSRAAGRHGDESGRAERSIAAGSGHDIAAAAATAIGYGPTRACGVVGQGARRLGGCAVDVRFVQRFAIAGSIAGEFAV